MSHTNNLSCFPLFHRYEEYKSWKDQPVPGPRQSGIGQFSLPLDQPLVAYSQTHPKQRAITNAIVEDLIVRCNLPLTIIENENFRHFLSVVDPKYTATTYRSVMKQVQGSVAETRTKLKGIIAEAEEISVTVDIWSDRRMRGFLGITAHVLTTDKGLRLNSHLLACSRFRGSHTGERISEAFEAICDEYDIKHKLNYIICDNAANMKKAFLICFPPQEEEDQDEDDESLDDSEIWEDLSATDKDIVEQVN